MAYRILSMYFCHDSNICLLEDGEPVLVLEKERVSRKKHDQGHMLEITKQALKDFNWDYDSIDLVVINPYTRSTFENEGFNWELKGKSYLSHPSYQKANWEGSPETRYSEHKIKFLDREYDCLAIDHHLAHMAGSLFTSPFENAGILSADGGGDYRYCALGHGTGNKIDWLEYDWGMEKPTDYSELNIGSTWASIGEANFGYARLEGAGKLMGLASYAEAPDALVDHIMRHALFYWAFPFPNYLFNQAQRLDPKSKFAQQLSAALQAATSHLFVVAANRLKEIKNPDYLCFTGGCAMNCIANTGVHLSGYFKDTYVPAQPSDSGLALGQALFAWHHVLNNQRTPKAWTPFLGTDIGDMSHDCIPEIVEALLDGKTVGTAFGKAESGPRALGHRSIIADPRRPNIKDHLNNNVKYREWFRPFAPFIIAEDYDQWFSDSVPSRYMSYASTVKPDKQEIIPGIVHVDGTARPQVVYKDEYPFFHALLTAWKQETKVPVLLNTSFNSREPLVDTEEQAFNTWQRTGLDIMVCPRGIFKDKKNIIESFYLNNLNIQTQNLTPAN